MQDKPQPGDEFTRGVYIVLFRVICRVLGWLLLCASPLALLVGAGESARSSSPEPLTPALLLFLTAVLMIAIDYALGMMLAMLRLLQKK